MEKRFCKCGDEIPEGRLKALPNATTCMKCSQTGRVSGHPLITGKTTYSELQIVSAETGEQLAKAQERVGYGISEGVRFDGDKHTNERV